MENYALLMFPFCQNQMLPQSIFCLHKRKITLIGKTHPIKDVQIVKMFTWSAVVTSTWPEPLAVRTTVTPFISSSGATCQQLGILAERDGWERHLDLLDDDRPRAGDALGRQRVDRLQQLPARCANEDHIKLGAVRRRHLKRSGDVASRTIF